MAVTRAPFRESDERATFGPYQYPVRYSDTTAPEAHLVAKTLLTLLAVLVVGALLVWGAP